MRVLLADDHTLFRNGLRRLFEDYGIEVVGEAPNGAAAIELHRRLKPDLTVIDLNMSVVDGIEATEAIVDEDPSARVLVITLTASDDEILDALLAGACGYVLKDTPPEQLIEAVRAAGAGDAMISPVVATKLVNRVREERRNERVQAPPKPPPLTSRERDILRLLAQGRENSAIAQELVISPATVKTHVAHLLNKLGLENRVQAAVFAVRHGIV
jgi:NarL family two-component system response regulator LiaR